jgi:hydrogenase-4 component B
VALRRIGVAGTEATAAVAAVLGWFALAHGGVTLGRFQGPIPALALEFGLTPLAAPFCALLAALGAAVGVWSLRRGRAGEAVLIALFSAAMLLVLCAQSVAVFFFAWEAVALISAFLIAADHERRSVRRASFVYLIVSQAGAACVLVALILLAGHAGSFSFAAIARASASLSAGERTTVFALALLGFGSKAGLVPLHFWLPRAHPVAPAGASALLSGAMLKVALYGLALVLFILAAPGPLAFGLTLIVLGTLSAVIGVLYALVDHDLKRLLAYHSVENVGIIVIGFGVALAARATGNAPLAGLGLVAALFHTINHALFKALLFLGAGNVAEEEGTVDLERLGGLWGHLVWTAPLFLIGCAAISALPPLNGFASEWLTFQSLVGVLAAAHRNFALAATSLGAISGLALTGGLAAACFVKVFGVGFLGQPRRPAEKVPALEVFGPPTFALTLLAALCVVLGVAPALAAVPLAAVAGAVLGGGTRTVAPPALSLLPLTLAALPVAGALLCVALARRRGVRPVPTWTCGSPVTPAASYTATAFSKPLRRIFAFVLAPESRRILEGGRSPWFPRQIVYRTESRYLVDEAARRFAAFALRLGRRSRVLQSGNLRLYLAYAVAAVIVTVVAAR